MRIEFGIFLLIVIGSGQASGEEGNSYTTDSQGKTFYKGKEVEVDRDIYLCSHCTQSNAPLTNASNPQTPTQLTPAPHVSQSQSSPENSSLGTYKFHVNAANGGFRNLAQYRSHASALLREQDAALAASQDFEKQMTVVASDINSQVMDFTQLKNSATQSAAQLGSLGPTSNSQITSSTGEKSYPSSGGNSIASSEVSNARNDGSEAAIASPQAIEPDTERTKIPSSSDQPNSNRSPASTVSLHTNDKQFQVDRPPSLRDILKAKLDKSAIEKQQLEPIGAQTPTQGLVASLLEKNSPNPTGDSSSAGSAAPFTMNGSETDAAIKMLSEGGPQSDSAAESSLTILASDTAPLFERVHAACLRTVKAGKLSQELRGG